MSYYTKGGLYGDDEDKSITQQLNSGVRALMLNIFDYKGDVWLCQGCDYKDGFVSQGPALDHLKEVETFLTSNSYEIVTLILEDRAPEKNTLGKVFDASGLTKYLFPLSKMPFYGEDWPIVKDMVTANQRLVVFSSSKSKQESEGIAYQCNFMRRDGGAVFEAVDFLNGKLLCGCEDVNSCWCDCWSLQTQIEAFNRAVQEDLPCMIEDPQELAEYLATLNFIAMGANDYILNFNNHHDPEYFANSLLIQNLVVNNIGPLGCLPSVINKTGNGQCDEQMNQNIMPYNSQLPQTLKNIQDEYPDTTLTLANSHDLLQDILADTEKYGFTDVKDPCCGTYVNGKLACIPNSTPCDNRCQYLFFDDSNTSELANCIFVLDMLIKD
ncbi:PI-PLC X domain-containing protein [Camellia lanceoleosa]|uniref:PI-PLC X domain-containing protein n=1 Tax=Camellia lanceoleosa TaxID=1840588 RepID=A0ACC0G053_9ERIC|nr:PI-PLC X domain-containing protein [Camellia lanceoleosa]